MTFLDFEKPVQDLEAKIAELRKVSGNGNVNIAGEISRMQAKADRLVRQLYAKLSPAQKVLVARHAERPHVSDYLSALVSDFTPLAGDRRFGEDLALIGGIGRIGGRTCVVMGQEKGDTTETRLRHNFGMARPEGYRKAMRLMDLADRFQIPIVTLVDTAGAYPGVGAEERGQSEAIAACIEKCLTVGVPIVSVIIGEGGSGGAIAIATADRVYMLEHAIYSVISPEGCASILWRSAAHAAEAAAALRLTAQDLERLGVIDGIIEEPLGGAHRAPAQAIERVGARVEESLAALCSWDSRAIRQTRRDKYLAMGRAA
jgi:acetyl-CoA carboxylase carboxyl transferase subunit alpha